MMPLNLPDLENWTYTGGIFFSLELAFFTIICKYCSFSVYEKFKKAPPSAIGNARKGVGVDDPLPAGAWEISTAVWMFDVETQATANWNSPTSLK